MSSFKKITKSIRPKILRRQIFLRYRLPPICPVADVNIEAFDRVAVFKKNRIAFNRLKKNANSTAMIALTRLETGLLLKSPRAAKYDAVRMDDASVLHCNIAKFDWLLIVRNPYSRTLSAFLEKFQQERYVENYGKFDLSSRGFNNFLCWLKDGGLNADYHWNLQTANIFLPVNLHNNIIRFETFQTEFLQFLKKRNPSIDAGFLEDATSIGAVWATRSEEKVDTFYNPASRKIVSELFDADFRILGYAQVD
jgi:hypothetical protein